MTIFYFTATGNSLYVAKRLGGSLMSIPQVLKSGKSSYADDVIGIVCPCYAGGIPRIVKRFLDRVELRADYIFSVITYGSAQTSVLDEMKKHGVQFNYMNTILMIDNYLPMFRIEDELKKEPQKEIEISISALIQDVRDRKRRIAPTSFGNKFWGAVFRSGAEKMTGENADQRFTVDNACTLCGTCTKVCPVRNISVNNVLSFNHQCEGCLACVHHCPAGAIHVKGEKSVRRFCNKNVGLNEVIAANG